MLCAAAVLLACSACTDDDSFSSSPSNRLTFFNRYGTNGYGFCDCTIFNSLILGLQ